MTAQRLEEEPLKTAFQIEGVPHIRQKLANWCGYASLSMVLQYWGYKDLTPERIIEHIHGEEIAEDFELNPLRLRDIFNLPAPSIDTLGLAAQELTPLKAALVTRRQYDILEAKDLSPKDVLRAYIVGRQVPCLVRKPRHFVVVTGVDIENGLYFLNNPSWSEPMAEYAESFESRWSMHDPDYPRDARNLLLAIYPETGE